MSTHSGGQHIACARTTPRADTGNLSRGKGCCCYEPVYCLACECYRTLQVSTYNCEDEVLRACKECIDLSGCVDMCVVMQLPGKYAGQQQHTMNCTAGNLSTVASTASPTVSSPVQSSGKLFEVTMKSACAISTSRSGRRRSASTRMGMPAALAARATTKAASVSLPSKYTSFALFSSLSQSSGVISSGFNAAPGVWMHVRVPPARPSTANLTKPQQIAYTRDTLCWCYIVIASDGTHG